MTQLQLNNCINKMSDEYAAQNKAYLAYLKTNDKLRYPCRECKQSFWTDRHLKAHSTIHDNSTATATLLLSCPICRRKITNQNGLKLHVKFKHLKMLSQFGACIICSKKFFQQSSLQTHILQMHKNDLEYLQKTTGIPLNNERLLLEALDSAAKSIVDKFVL
jgi:uncharacterized protein with PIN domain